MTTAFQYVFDYAESISINKRAVVSQTITRDQTVRTVDRGGQVWRFEVRLPDGIRWSDARPYIEAMEDADRFTVGTVQLNNAGYNSYLTNYLGDGAQTNGIPTGTYQAKFTVALSSSNPDTIALTSLPTFTSGQYVFRQGDIVQLGTGGHVYSVAQSLQRGSGSLPINLKLNRPILETPSDTTTYTLAIGPAATWSVICAEFPTWTVFARNQVSWSGPFVFYENLV
jgi:hypothetical protein